MLFGRTPVDEVLAFLDEGSPGRTSAALRWSRRTLLGGPAIYARASAASTKRATA